MYAPPYYAPPQQLVPGFILPYQPIYHTPDQGRKRESSPLLLLSGEKDEKRSRNEGSTSGSIDQSTSDGQTCTLMDLMNEMKKLATKDNLAQVKGSILAQSAEIQQLRSEIGKHNDRIKQLEDQMGERAAASLNRTQPRPEETNVNRNQYGTARMGPDQERFQNRRRSVIIHGLRTDEDTNLMEHVLDIFQAMGAIIFASDIVDIERLGKSDVKSDRPRPVRVVFEQYFMRDKVMKKKGVLATKVKYTTIFVNADEPADIRRTKGFFRRVAYKAKTLGKEVNFRSEWIQIDGITYSASELDKIPVEYTPDPPRPRTTNDGGAAAAPPPLELVPDVNRPKPDDMVEPTVVGKMIKDLCSDPNVNIALTNSGLTFSGPTAFCSNMYPCDFVFNDQPYNSTEQGIQHQHALHEKVSEIAKKILDTKDAKEIKKISHDIPKI